MTGKTLGQRVDRLERVIEIIAEDQVSLQKLIADLAIETRKGFDRVAQQFAETNKKFAETAERFAETDRRMRETDERLRQTNDRLDKIAAEDRERGRQVDERIDKLVLAIGELIRRQNGAPH